MKGLQIMRNYNRRQDVHSDALPELPLDYSDRGSAWRNALPGITL